MSRRSHLPAVPPPIAPYSGLVVHLLRENRTQKRSREPEFILALDGAARILSLGQLHALGQLVQQFVAGHLVGMPRPWDDDPGRTPFASRPGGPALAAGVTGRTRTASPTRPTPAAGSGT